MGKYVWNGRFYTVMDGRFRVRPGMTQREIPGQDWDNEEIPGQAGNDERGFRVKPGMREVKPGMRRALSLSSASPKG